MGVRKVSIQLLLLLSLFCCDLGPVSFVYSLTEQSFIWGLTSFQPCVKRMVVK